MKRIARWRCASGRRQALTWLSAQRARADVPALHELGIVLCTMRRYDEAEPAARVCSPDRGAVGRAGGVYICRPTRQGEDRVCARACAAPGTARPARLRHRAPVRRRVRARLPIGSAVSRATRSHAGAARSGALPARAWPLDEAVALCARWSRRSRTYGKALRSWCRRARPILAEPSALRQCTRPLPSRSQVHDRP